MHPDCQPDDPSIPDSAELLRRIHPDNINPKNGKILPDAFDDIMCSIDVKSKGSLEKCLAYLHANQIKLSKLNEAARYAKFFNKGWRVASVVASIPRSLSQTVYFEAEKVKFKDKEIINEAHGLICGEKDDEVLYELAKNAVVL